MTMADLIGCRTIGSFDSEVQLFCPIRGYAVLQIKLSRKRWLRETSLKEADYINGVPE